MPILGGSPLGLIGVESRPRLNTAASTLPFDGGSIGVARYNQAADSYRPITVNRDETDDADNPPTINTENPNSVKSSISIFTRSRFTPWPKISRKKDGLGILDDGPDITQHGLSPSRLHSDTMYDTSILSILKQLKGTKAELRSADFAYLKNVGVFPNNRLMVARRFGGAAEGVANLMRNGSRAMAVMISWVPQGEDFFSIDFGEEWVEAEADFTSLLNDLGNDFMKGSGLGTKLGGGVGAVPLPGFTETLQRLMFEKLGVLSEGSSSFIPAGEPNLIKQAKRRKTVGYSEAGSGLKCGFQVKMICEYEQKFISGLDPTVVWLDIVQTALRFGTSPSTSYGLSGGIMAKIMAFVNDPLGTIKRALSALSKAINDFKAAIKNAISKFLKSIEPKPEGPPSPATPNGQVSEEEKKAFKDTSDALWKKFNSLFVDAVGKLDKLLRNIVGKYKVRIRGILAALSGAASGPWHVTIGNPMRPVFSSGDLIVSDTVKLSFGPTLAFNDLPSTIKVEFTLVPARPLGLQEIMGRFNSGHVRSIKAFPSDEEKEAIATQLKIGLEKVRDDDAAGDNRTDETRKAENAKLGQYFGEQLPDNFSDEPANNGVSGVNGSGNNNNQSINNNSTQNSGTGGGGGGGT